MDILLIRGQDVILVLSLDIGIFVKDYFRKVLNGFVCISYLVRYIPSSAYCC